MSERTVKEYRKQADRYVVPALGKRKIRDVARRDGQSARDEPSAGNSEQRTGATPASAPCNGLAKCPFAAIQSSSATSDSASLTRRTNSLR